MESSSDEDRVKLTAFKNVTSVKHVGYHKLDPVILQECQQITMELNQETACYSSMVVRLGSCLDSEDLRSELKQTRLRGLELAHINKLKLIPLMRRSFISPNDTKELDRLYNMFCGCLELLEIQLNKTLSLVQMFPLYSDNQPLIKTGYVGPFFLCKQNHAITVESLDSVTSTLAKTEQEEIKILQQDVKKLGELLYQINQKIDVQPWATEEDNEFDHAGIEKASDNSGTNTTIVSVGNNRKRRCLCFVISVVFVLSITALIVGVVMGAL